MPFWRCPLATICNKGTEMVLLDVCTGINVSLVNVCSVHHLVTLSTFHPAHFTVKLYYGYCSKMCHNGNPMNG